MANNQTYLHKIYIQIVQAIFLIFNVSYMCTRQPVVKKTNKLGLGDNHSLSFSPIKGVPEPVRAVRSN